MKRSDLPAARWARMMTKRTMASLSDIRRRPAAEPDQSTAKPGLEPNETAVALRRIRLVAFWTALGSASGALVLSFALYKEFRAPSNQAGPGWWDWIRAAHTQWDPVGSLAFLSGTAMSLFIATFITLGNRQSTHEDGERYDALIISLESVTVAACFSVAAMSWMLVPAAASSPAAPEIKVIFAVGAAILFSTMAAIAEPSRETKRYNESIRIENAICLQGQRKKFERRLAKYSRDVSGQGRWLPGRGCRARTEWRILALIGALYGLSVAVLNAVTRVFSEPAVSGLSLAAGLVAFPLFDGLVLAWFGIGRVQASVARQVDGRFVNLTMNILLLSMAALYSLPVIVLASAGELRAAVFVAALFFGPTVLFALIRKSVYVDGLRHREVRRRLRFVRRKLPAEIVASPSRRVIALHPSDVSELPELGSPS